MNPCSCPSCAELVAANERLGNLVAETQLKLNEAKTAATLDRDLLLSRVAIIANGLNLDPQAVLESPDLVTGAFNGLREEVVSLRHHVVATGDAGEMAVDVAKGLRDQRDDAAKKRDEYRTTIEAMDRVFRRLCRSVGVTPSPSMKPQVLEDAVEALKKTAGAPCAPKTVGEALTYLAWAVGEDHGASSSAMFTRLTGLPSDDGAIGSWPFDLDDFGRCVRLVERFPVFAQHLEYLRGISSQWDHIVSNWPRLVQAYQHDDAEIVREVLR